MELHVCPACPPSPCHFPQTPATHGALVQQQECSWGDLGPRLTWAAARTFWYKLLPWRGSGGPVKTAGQRQEGQHYGLPRSALPASRPGELSEPLGLTLNPM